MCWIQVGTVTEEFPKISLSPMTTLPLLSTENGIGEEPTVTVSLDVVVLDVDVLAMIRFATLRMQSHSSSITRTGCALMPMFLL